MRVKGKDSYAQQINNVLDQWMRNIGAKYDKIFHREGYVSAEKVDNEVMGVDIAKNTLLKLFKEHNEEFEKKVGK